jgi:2-C-methyl-D-erythritol 2,4-cyclodiphosphate synthase
LVLGGVAFEHDRGPVSHSDGDALLHAVTDALLGALGGPDIGQLFPDTNRAHQNADSAIFLAEACRRMTQAGWKLGNLDATIICQRPAIGPRRDEIVHHLAELLDCAPEQLNLKGKTHEHVDAVGEERAIEVHVVVLLCRD